VSGAVHTRAHARWRRYETQLKPILDGLRPYTQRLAYDDEGDP
jgi:hypothetical protein